MEAPGDDERTRVLIVDDHEDNIELLRARLDAWGFVTESAGDGEEALQLIEASPPDLILLDVMMPKIDGMEVARRVKGNRALPFIPIIMQTALDATENKVEGLEAGADDYITKPIDFAELKARLNSMLRITSGCGICRRPTPSPGSITAAISRNASTRCSSTHAD